MLIDILGLNVNGTATLNGELKFVGSDYAGLALGYSFDILIANAIVGEFASVSNRTINEDWMWKLDYGLDGSSVTATVSAVPLPAAAWLFISAIAGLAGAKRMSGPFCCQAPNPRSTRAVAIDASESSDKMRAAYQGRGFQ